MKMTRREFIGANGALAGTVLLGALPAAANQGGSTLSPAIAPACLTASLAGWPLAELVAAGYRSLELTPSCLEQSAQWQGAAERAGLRPICVNALDDLRPYLTGSLSDAVAWRRRDTLDRLLRALQRMHREGIPFLVVAPSRLAENYQSVQEARGLLVGSLRELAAAGDTSILLEAAPFRLFASASEIASIVDEAARPNVAAALNVGHALLSGESPAEAARILGQRLRYVQVNDADTRPGVPHLDRHLPLGLGAAKADDVRAAVGGRPFAVTVAAPSAAVNTAIAALEWLRPPPPVAG
jgi:sugar phosphate isomerase/epimerase